MTATLAPVTTTAPTKLLVGVYLRMSKDAELGIDRQREDCHALAAKLGWDVREYVDNDRSAVKENVTREGYDDMLADIREGRIDAIIAWRSDRLYRKTKDLLPLIELIQGMNKGGKRIPIETVQTGLIDLTTDAGRMTAKILAAVSENEGEVRTARQLRAYEQIAASGRPLGAPHAFGYTNWPYDPQIEPNEAQAIRQGYADLLAGCTMGSIARKWNEAGCRTHAGNPFIYVTTARILRNPRNAGLHTFRGEIIGQGKWEPIVDVATWEAAVRIMDGQATGKVGKRQRTNLLSGIARCGACGGALSGNTNSQGVPIYKCKHYEHCRHGVTRLRKKVDPYIESRIIARLEQKDWVVGTQADAEAAKGLHAEAETLRARKDSFGEALADGTLTPAQVKDATKRVNDKLADIDAKLARYTRSRAFDGLLGHDDMEAAWEALDIDRKRAIIELLCDKIVVKHVGVTGRAAAKLPLGHGITIHWHKPSDD